ncbi:hypothetical protein BpHYR1_023639 [Brachionus plicatilis]|uniref:Uncharacterized protein n=1 Tax=Brachionus plicatilis TaxID=10195 RepID=A0A3M7RUD0_BRAPC|nr:hypothetical protein BpHYR1_023639 [Brachionus plicatilis]
MQRIKTKNRNVDEIQLNHIMNSESVEPKTQSHESVSLDPSDQTLDDVDVFLGKILKSPKSKKKRGKAIMYDMHCEFDNFKDMERDVLDGNGDTWIFKKQDGDKYRYYCKYLNNGCRATLYLEGNKIILIKYKLPRKIHTAGEYPPKLNNLAFFIDFLNSNFLALEELHIYSDTFELLYLLSYDYCFVFDA